MSYMLPHLHNGWQVDQAILSEEDRVVVSPGTNAFLAEHPWPQTCIDYRIAHPFPGYPIRSRLGPCLYENGRGDVQHSGEG